LTSRPPATRSPSRCSCTSVALALTSGDEARTAHGALHPASRLPSPLSDYEYGNARAVLTARARAVWMSWWRPIACSRSRSDPSVSPLRLSCSSELAIASELLLNRAFGPSSAFLSRATSTSVSAEIKPASATSKRSLAPAISPTVPRQYHEQADGKKNGELARNEPYSARRSKRPRSTPSVRSAGCVSVRRTRRAHTGGRDADGIRLLAVIGRHERRPLAVKRACRVLAILAARVAA